MAEDLNVKGTDWNYRLINTRDSLLRDYADDQSHTSTSLLNPTGPSRFRQNWLYSIPGLPSRRNAGKPMVNDEEAIENWTDVPNTFIQKDTHRSSVEPIFPLVFRIIYT